MEQPLLNLQQRVRLSETHTLYSMFPDEVGTVLERRYHPEKCYWLYMVQFLFGIYPMPEFELRPAEEEIVS